MSRRDPFPMSSEEAQKLAESVHSSGEDEEKGEEWHTMTTRSQGAGPSGSTKYGDSGASQGLVGKAGGKKKKRHGGKGRGKKKDAASGEGEEDIYANVDAEDDDGVDDEDEFLDRPIWESRGSPTQRAGVRVVRFLDKIYHRLYGDQLPVSEMLRTLCLASTLFFMIGGYWLLRSLKDPVLTALCGVTVIPKAKILSVFVVLAVVSVYNHLLDSDIPKHKLFYLFGTFYFGLFVCISLLLMHPTIGLANQDANPRRVLGWISYCSIESFGSVMVSLFWSFTNSNFSLETAKASYGVMVAAAQVGSIIGPTVVNRLAETWGPAKCYLMGACCMLLLQGTMYNYIRIYGSSERNATPAKKKSKAGITEGLLLFWEHNYVKGIFAISCLFMVEVTIVDYTMKVLASDFFAEEHPCLPGNSCFDYENGEHKLSAEATASFATFMGFFGQVTNTLSFLMSLFGTSALIRFLGLRFSLLVFPSLCLAVIIFVRLRPTLYVVFGAMVLLKGFSYAFNNPTKEMLYQPTSSAVKYKAKSWIDIFGARGSKAMGSVVNNAFSSSTANLISNGSLVGMCVASFLIWNAHFMGKKFDEYTSTGYIVGEDPDEQTSEEKNIEMASNQNEGGDTSCAIYDDDHVGPEEEGQESENGDDDENGDEEDQITADVKRV